MTGERREMVLEAQQIERVEAENRAGPAGARERMAIRRDALIDRLLEILEATAFSNRFLLPPRRLPQIAKAEADAFLDFLKTGDADRIREQGVKRAEEGLGERAMLRLGTTLRQFCRDERADEALRAADVYANALLEGFMEGREALVLREQEQIRKALQRVASKRALQLATAAEVSHAASSILDTDELLAEIVYLICDRFDLYYVGIFLVDETGEYVVLRAGTGEAGLQMLKAGHKFKIGSPSMVGWCAANAKARIALDVGREAVRFDNPLLPETRSEVALPLISRGWVIGVMTIQSTKPDAFSEEDIAVLQTMADQLANAIENARLFEEALARTREVTALAETGRKLASTLELDAVLDFVMDACLELLQVQQACFIMMDKAGYLRMRRHRGLSEEFVRSIVGRPGEGFFGKVYQSGEAILVRDAREQIDPATAEAVLREGITSFVHVPVRVKGETVAVLNVTSSREDLRFSERDLERLSAFANQAAIAIENARLFEETQAALAEIAALYQASQRITAAEAIEDILQAVLDYIVQPYLDRVLIGLFDPDAPPEEPVIAVSAIWDRAPAFMEALRGQRFTVSELPMIAALDPNTIMVVNNIDTDERLDEATRLSFQSFNAKSVVALPITAAGDHLGWMLIETTRDYHTFTEEELRPYQSIIGQAAVAIANARAYEREQRRADQLRLVNEVGRTLTSILDVDTLMGQVVRLIRDAFDYYQINLGLIEGNTLVPKAWAGAVSTFPVESARLELDAESIVTKVATSGTSLLVPDVRREPLYLPLPGLDEIRSELAVPLKSKGQVIGVLDVESDRLAAFDETELTVLEALAGQIAVAIENARLFEQTQVALAQTDALYTGSARVIRATTMDDVLQALIHSTTLQRLDRVSIAFFNRPWEDEIPEEATIVATWEHRGEESRAPVGTHYLLAQFPAIEAVTRDEPTIFRDITTDERMYETLRVLLLDRLGMRSLVLWPLVAGGQWIGFLNGQAATVLEIDEDNIRQITNLIDQAATVIQNIRLLEQTQRRAIQLETAAEVSRAATSTLDTGQLLAETVNLIRDRFDLYHVGIFLLDEAREYAVLQAGTGEAGQQMLKQGHKLKVGGTSMIGWCTANGQACIALDVGKEAVRFDNPLLPRTRSEMALPLTSRGQVIGAMTIQSDQPAAFSEEDTAALQTMADQLANAIENARLFQETKANLEEITFLHQRYLQETWGKFLDEETGRERTGYMYNWGTVSPASTVWRPEIGLAVQRRDTIALSDMANALQGTVEEVGAILQAPPPQSSLAVPLKVRGQVIGALDFYETDQARDWSAEDIAIVEAVANQVALAIENARAYEELQKTAEQLKEIDRLKTQFLANMSHELRTPLNSIIGFSRVILKGIDGPITEQQRVDLTSIYNNGQHLLGMINDILDISKIGAGRMELLFEPVDMQQVISGVVSTATALVKDKPVELKQEVAPDLPIIRADGSRVRQVILNLLSNAAKFTEEGQITLRAWAGEEQITISVEDTGIGIAPEHQALIFEEFRQVDGSTTRRTGGTGLGLAISRHFVEMHGGHIWMESEPGVGSTFTFTLPITGPAPVAQELATLPIDPSRKLILAIEDDEGAIVIYKRYLEKQGYQVVGLNQGDQAVHWALELSPYAIILDVLLPGKDGWAVLEELKSSREVHQIPVIICTIIDDEEARGLSLGAADYLVKPVLEEDLLHALQRLEERQRV